MSEINARGQAFGATIQTSHTPEHHWVCPNCTLVYVTHDAEVHTPFHPCRGLNGLMSPFVPDKTNCKIEVVEREDYVGNEIVTKDGAGRPIMAVVTTRDDGEDRAIMAPTAQGDIHGLD